MGGPGWVPGKRGKWSDVQDRQQYGGWFKTRGRKANLGAIAIFQGRER